METPLFTVTPRSLDLVAKIAEKVGELQGSGEYARNLKLRKVNRLRSIQSSLAIENNSLSLDEVADIVQGKRVLGKPREIQEAKNAYAAYEHLTEYDPYSVGDLLTAHGYLTAQLVERAGVFRSKDVESFGRSAYPCGRKGRVCATTGFRAVVVGQGFRRAPAHQELNHPL